MSESKSEHNAPILRRIGELLKKLAEYEKILALIQKYQSVVKKLDLSLQDDVINPVKEYDLAGNNEWRGANFNNAKDQIWADIKSKLGTYLGETGELLGDIAKAIKTLTKMITDTKEEIKNLRASLW